MKEGEEGNVPWEFLYQEIKGLTTKVDGLKGEISDLREEIAEHRVRIQDDRKFQSAVWGIVSGVLSAGSVAIIDIYLKK